MQRRLFLKTASATTLATLATRNVWEAPTPRIAFGGIGIESGTYSRTLHIEGLYAFRLDLTGDAREDVVFKFRFNEPRHVNGDEHVHVQKFQVRRATGEAIGGDKGELLIEGDTGKVHSTSGIQAFVGIAPDMFAADAVGTQNLQKAFYNEHRYDGEAFLRQRQNFFKNRNITAIVLEVPNNLIGKGTVHAWATVSLYGHAPEMQVSRWGLPMITHLFLNDPGNQEVKETFNKSVPSDDIALFSGIIADYTQKMTTYAGSAMNPEEYGKQMVSRLCPTTLPYELGTAAAFDLARFNGRPLGDDVMDVMLTLATNRPLQDGAALIAIGSVPSSHILVSPTRRKNRRMSYHGTHVVVIEIPEGSWGLRVNYSRLIRQVLSRSSPKTAIAASSTTRAPDQFRTCEIATFREVEINSSSVWDRLPQVYRRYTLATLAPSGTHVVGTAEMLGLLESSCLRR
jgi:Domain of unknown function (DUF4331)